MERKKTAISLYLLSYGIAIVGCFLVPKPDWKWLIFLTVFLITLSLMILGVIYRVKKTGQSSHRYGRATIAPAMILFMWWLLLLVPDFADYLSYTTPLHWVIFSLMMVSGTISLIAWRIANSTPSEE